MLTTCPECGLQVSTKAYSCPHCGYPMRIVSKAPRNYPKHRHKRLPNGFGSITKVKRALRKPFYARVCIGKTANGRPVLKSIGYFETYNAAYEALVEYNKNPYDLTQDITLKAIYERWSKEYYLPLNQSTINDHENAWAHCKKLWDMKISDIRGRHIRALIEDQDSVYHKQGVKMLFNLLFDYAMEYDLVQTNYARALKLKISADSKPKEPAHNAFSKEELDVLWSNTDDWVARAILIQCYTGFRPRELLSIKITDISLTNWTIIGGMKTDAGRDRIVPIHTKIRPLVLEAIKNNSTHLIEGPRNAEGMKYNAFHKAFGIRMRDYGLGEVHKPHDGRKTFITMAKAAGMDEYAIKRIVGHAISDVTEGIYTERPVSWLSGEIEKIKV